MKTKIMAALFILSFSPTFAQLPAPTIDPSDTNTKVISTETPIENAPIQTADTTSSPPAVAPQKVVSDTIMIRNPFLSKLSLGGTVQLKAFYHNMFDNRDADKKLSLTLRKLKIDLKGAVDDHAGFESGLILDANNRALGIDDGYLYYTVNDLVGFKGGKLRRPFSQEALASSQSLSTVERGELYHDFLTSTTGYAFYDVGLIAYGGFAEEGRTLGYEVGIFNGKQNDNTNGSYAGQQYETQDKGFKAKDFVMRVTAMPVKDFNVEAAVSTKAAEDTSNSDAYLFNVNTAYEVGANYSYQPLNLMGEISWGDNHNKRDAQIINGASQFFAFYATAIWKEKYTRGRASETVLKIEGLDPDFEWSKGKGKANDGLLRYTLGSNYFFTPRTSVLTNYTILHPITKITGQGNLNHGLDLMWRLTF